jgi:hypothetical protein
MMYELPDGRRVELHDRTADAVSFLLASGEIVTARRLTSTAVRPAMTVREQWGESGSRLSFRDWTRREGYWR